MTRSSSALPEENNAIKATYSRRRLTENGLCSFGLESRFSAVLSKAAEVAYSQIDLDRSPGNRNGQKAAKVFEKAESMEMAFSRLVGIR